MKTSSFPITRRVLCSTAAAVLLVCHGTAAFAATPKDTLIVAAAFDDIITMDPGESFEISAGEIMGNAYDRLLRYDVVDPSKLISDLAKTWAVSADGKTYTFELRAGMKFASGNPITAEDVVFSLQRAVMMDKSPAFILTQFGLSKTNVKDKVKQTGPLTLTFETDKAYAPTFVYNCLTANVAAIVDKKLVMSKEVNGDLGAAWLKTNYAGSGPLKLREWRANEIIALERNDNYYGEKSKNGAGHLPPPEGIIDPAPAAGKRRCGHCPQPDAARPGSAGQQQGNQNHVHAKRHGVLHQPEPEKRQPRQA